MSEPQQPPVPPYAQQPPAAYPPAVPAQPTAQPYGAPPQGFPAAAPASPATAAPSARSGNSLGRVAFIVALITFALSLLLSLMVPLLYQAVGFDHFVISLVQTANSLIGLAGNAVALILGLIAIRRPGSPLLAGIAIGLAGSGVVATVFGWITTLFYSFI